MTGVVCPKVHGEMGGLDGLQPDGSSCPDMSEATYDSCDSHAHIHMIFC